MLIYSKPLTAEVHSLWAVLPLYVQMHHIYSKVHPFIHGRIPLRFWQCSTFQSSIKRKMHIIRDLINH